MFTKLSKGLFKNLGTHLIPELDSDEAIEIHGPANLLLGIEGVAGVIFSTNKSLIFNEHRYNIQRGQTDIVFQEIESIEKRKTAKLIDNGFRIKTKDDKSYDFVVNDRGVWLEKLNERVGKEL